MFNSKLMGFKLGSYLIGAVFVALLVYTISLGAFFGISKAPKEAPIASNTPQSFVQTVKGAVLADMTTKPTPTPFVLPDMHKVVMIPRKQIFNLSCEFAAAAAILYHYTGNIAFAKDNAKSAEELLMKEVGVSDNPNVGIRMGLSEEELSEDNLYSNLGEQFGGSTYYGIHAPPFIDVFAKYHLKARPILKGEDMIKNIQQALYGGHLVMTWLRIGYGGKVDVVFTYGTVPVIKGEHSVVIHGYDKTGFFIMDPGNGGFSHIKYQDLLNSSNFFTLPFLEVFEAENTDSTLEETVPLSELTGLARTNLTIVIENATKEVGKGTQISEILREFGYRVVDVTSKRNKELLNIHIKLKKTHKDYSYILKKDLTVSHYAVASISADLSASSSADAVISVGE